MDDKLEQPFPPSQLMRDVENGDISGEEDDEGPDWTKLKSFPSSSSKPSLPKRGDKEFEPSINGPTNLQIHSLNRARDAMFAALDVERGISNKSVSYAVWYGDLARAHVTQMRGVLFNGLGHSVPRTAPRTDLKREEDGVSQVRKKRIELLPEETLYLIERGSLFCWKYEPDARLPNGGEGDEGGGGGGEHDMCGSPMSVQQAFAEMIGREELTLERYHAYAYLKRLGFNVLRAKPPSPFYPIPASSSSPVVSLGVSQSQSRSHLLARIFNRFANVLSRLQIWVLGRRRIDWWRPLSFGWFGCASNYSSVYRALRIIPSGHTVPLHPSVSPSSKSPSPDSVSNELHTPYEIFYLVYKPNTPFKKSAPPPPDYSLVVVDARTTPLPTLRELTYLWSFLPETGPPVPRIRNPKALPNPAPPQSENMTVLPSPPSTFARLFPWVFGRSSVKEKEQQVSPRKPNPFAVLRAGKKTIVIGIVDNGTVGFFRFSMGAFEEMPMVV